METLSKNYKGDPTEILGSGDSIKEIQRKSQRHPSNSSKFRDSSKIYKGNPREIQEILQTPVVLSKKYKGIPKEIEDDLEGLDMLSKKYIGNPEEMSKCFNIWRLY